MRPTLHDGSHHELQRGPAFLRATCIPTHVRERELETSGNIPVQLPMYSTYSDLISLPQSEGLRMSCLRRVIPV